MAKYNSSGFPSTGVVTTGQLKQELDEIAASIADQLDRKGASPNNMEVDLDMNSRRILNLPDALSDSEPLTLRQFNGQATGVKTTGTLKSKVVATAGQTVFVTPGYVVGSNNLHVYVNGVRQANDSYSEDNANQVTFTSPLQAGDVVEFVVNELPEGSGTIPSTSVTHNGETVATVLNKRFFNSVADMVADTTLKIGDIVQTLGYYSEGDGGGNIYEIVAAGTGTADGGSYIDLTGVSGQAKGLFVDGAVNVRQFGAKGDWDGASGTDDSAAIQAAVDTGMPVYVPRGRYKVDSGILLFESSSIRGAGSVIGLYDSSPSYSGKDAFTEFYYTGTGNFITVDGKWLPTPWEPRRNIRLGGFTITAGGAMNAGLSADFMTIFEIDDVYVDTDKATGTLQYGFYLVNCYSGQISNTRLQGAQVANCYYAVKNDATDNVFTGQVFFNNCEFWKSKNATNNGAGLITEAPLNVLEQIVLVRPHFMDNDIGLWHKSGGSPLLLQAHFEDNSINDVLSESVSINPYIIGFFVNNPTSTECIKYKGSAGCVKSGRFTEVVDGSAGVSVDSTAKGVALENFQFRMKSGVTSAIAIKNAGVGTHIKDIHLVRATSGAWSGAITNTGSHLKIENLIPENITAGCVTDTGSSTQYLDAEVFCTNDLALEGGNQKEGYYTNKEMYVNRAWLIYPSGTSTGTTTINIGRSASAGTEDLTKYLNGYATGTGLGTWERVDLTSNLTGTPYLASGDVLIVYTPGGSATAAKARLVVEMTPYRATH